MVFLDFEKDLESLHEQLDKVRQIGEKGDLDVAPMIDELEQRIVETRDDLYANLSGWQRVQLSRHPERPYTLYYVKQLAPDFIELHGDRTFGDDKAMVGGIGSIDGQTCVFVGQQKGVNTKLRQYRNFGMPNPEGYRKALRLMKLAERFGFPVISLIDTPGAFPGIEAEARGQAEAIARNLFEMAQLRTPIISIVIGEGASGGAIGIGLSDRSYMMENTWYSVISPESCSSILWRSWDQKERAAEELHLTAEDMLRFGIIDGVIAEPKGGAHTEREQAAEALRAQIKTALTELQALDHDTLVARRIDKYDNIGVYREGDTIQYHSATPPAAAARGRFGSDCAGGHRPHGHRPQQAYRGYRQRLEQWGRNQRRECHCVDAHRGAGHERCPSRGTGKRQAPRRGRGFRQNPYAVLPSWPRQRPAVFRPYPLAQGLRGHEPARCRRLHPPSWARWPYRPLSLRYAGPSELRTPTRLAAHRRPGYATTDGDPALG